MKRMADQSLMSDGVHLAAEDTHAAKRLRVHTPRGPRPQPSLGCICRWVSGLRRLNMIACPQCLICFDNVARSQVFALVSPPGAGAPHNDNRHAKQRGTVHHFHAVCMAKHVLQSQTCPVTRRPLVDVEVTRLSNRLRTLATTQGVADADYGPSGFKGALVRARFLRERDVNIQNSCLGIRNEADVWMNMMLHVAADTHVPAWVRRDMIKSFCKQRYLDELGDLLRISVKEAARMLHDHRKLLTFQRVRQNMLLSMRTCGGDTTKLTAQMHRTIAQQVQQREETIDRQAKAVDESTDWMKCWPHRPFASAAPRGTDRVTSSPSSSVSVDFETMDTAAEREDAAQAMVHMLKSCEDPLSRGEDTAGKAHPESSNVLRPTFDVVYAVIAAGIQKIHIALSHTCMRHHALFVKNVQEYARTHQQSL